MNARLIASLKLTRMYALVVRLSQRAECWNFNRIFLNKNSEIYDQASTYMDRRSALLRE